MSKNKKNMTLKGQRISSVEELENGYIGFTLKIRQRILSKSFSDLVIWVIVPHQIWLSFAEHNPTDWLYITGSLISTRKLIEGRQYIEYAVKARYIGKYDALLYEELGGECIFSGDVKLLKKSGFDSNEPPKNSLYGMKVFCKDSNRTFFEAVAMRDRVNDFVSLEKGSIVHLIATFMPSDPPYISVKETSAV